jgi:hypothetical protein
MRVLTRERGGRLPHGEGWIARGVELPELRNIGLSRHAQTRQLARLWANGPVIRDSGL